MENIHQTAEIDESATIPASTKVWAYTQIRENVVVGENCIIGRNVYIGPGVVIGSNCKIQNNALIYEPAVIEDGVFVGPAAVLTNDKHPRAINQDGTLKSAADWDLVGVYIESGASIGAHAVCVAPVRIGSWAVVGANSVVTRDVGNQDLVAGNPAKLVGKAKF
jgi:acetyltransferase-like isoleucine patch superfamily enzyme